jgi:hypothetical protein
MRAYERKDSDWAAKYLAKDLKIQVMSLGTITVMEDFERIVAWEYEATQGSQLEYESVPLQFPRFSA